MRTTNSDPIEVMLKIWRKSPGKFFCVSTKSPTGKWKDTFFKRSNMRGALSFAKKHARSHNVYMSTHGFSKARRHKECSEDPCVLYADLDARDPRTLDIKPTIAIESSPGRFVGYWFTDVPASEDLNRRLAYYIGADTSGWDRTQVLRVPGTRNHKYKTKPTVKLLWDDGPRYEVRRLEKIIPKVETNDGREEGGDAMDIYRKYEKALPIWARREFLNPRVQQGKRSEVLWKLINECLEAGMTEDETFTLCWHSPWNKHAERRDGERQMRRELEKAIGRHIGGSIKKAGIKKKSIMDREEADPSKIRYEFVTMDEVEEEEVDWIVPRMVARQQTTIFEGDPGVGKSYFLMWMAVHWCNGTRLPWQNKTDPVEPLRVLYCDMENSAGSVTKVRLNDNGLKNGKNYVQFTQPFSVDNSDSIEAFENQVLRKFKPDVVIIDPINLYVGSADTYKASETQQALQVLKALSERYNFALIIVRHLNKSASGKALYAGQGSIAFAGVARIVATIGWHPEESDMRVVACTKNNLSPFFGSLGYTIEALPETLNRKDRSQLVYEGHVDYTSDEIVGTTNQKEEGSVAIAMDLIREMLKASPDGINYHSLIKQADTRSISEASIRKAAASLKMKKIIRGRGVKRTTLLVMSDE
jgi:Predicted ATP-dependent serine protease